MIYKLSLLLSPFQHRDENNRDYLSDIRLYSCKVQKYQEHP